MENGYYTEGVGTAWSFMADAAANYGVQAMELGLDEDSMKYYLDRGCPIICAMHWDFETLRYQIKNLWVYQRS